MLHTLVIFMDLLNDQMQTGQLCNQQNVQLRLLLSSLAPLRTFILSPCQRFKLSCLYFYRYVSFNYVFIQVLVEFYKDPSRFNFVIAYYSVVGICHSIFFPANFNFGRIRYFDWTVHSTWHKFGNVKIHVQAAIPIMAELLPYCRWSVVQRFVC